MVGLWLSPSGESSSGNYGWTDSLHNEGRDLVVYDQRGTGIAEPSLECEEVDAAWIANLQRAETHEAEVDRRAVTSVGSCRPIPF